MKLNIVPARTGITWVRLGIATFFRQPLAMAGLFFLYMAAIILVAQIPFIGVFIGGMLVPGATLGLMAAAAEAAKGKFPMPTVLLSAFRAGRAQGRAMLILGAIYTAGSLVATRLAMLLAGPVPGQATELDPAALLGLAFHAPLFLMFWHAPALVHWHGVTPVKSLFFSVVACVRNFGALTVYGLLWLGVFLGAGIVFGLVGGAIGGATLARAVMMPTALLLAAMFSTSIYFSFRDSFVGDDIPPPGDPQ
jgi:hypothetical protein